MATSLVPLILMAVLTIAGTVGYVLPKRNSADNAPDNYDYYDYPGKYDDYPVVVSKRAALLLDRLMVALQKAVEDQDGAGGFAADRSVRATAQQQSHQLPPSSSMNNDKSSIDRRAQGKGRVYWRCYFNAVTCFKK